MLRMKVLCLNHATSKGQIKPKADLRALDSPKKQTNEFVLFFAFLLFTAKKNKFVHRFLGESTARKTAYGFICPLVAPKRPPEN